MIYHGDNDYDGESCALRTDAFTFRKALVEIIVGGESGHPVGGFIIEAREARELARLFDLTADAIESAKAYLDHGLENAEFHANKV